MKRQKRVLGDVVKIELGQDTWSYGRVLDKGLFAFYDLISQEDVPLTTILARPILFKIGVMDSAVKKGRWQIVGHAPLEDDLMIPPLQFMQDMHHPESFSLYEAGNIRPATREECVGLERVAAWDAEHVESRLRDHYAGLPNKWVESLKIK